MLVTVHEFGHFWVARKLGVKVLRFSVGFGKPIWRKVAGKDQVEYILAAIPLGGYVKMLGEGDDTPIDPSEAHRAIDRQPIWKRSLIVVAGPAINFLFAIILFVFVGMQSEDHVVPVFGDFSETSVVAQASVLPGDTLLEVDGRKVKHMYQRDLYIFNKVLKEESIEIKIDGAQGKRTVNLDTTDIPVYNISPSLVVRQLGLIPLSPPTSTEIDFVAEGSPADVAGLKKGDKFVMIENESVEGWQDLVEVVAVSPEKALALKISRDGVLFDFSITPEAKQVNDRVIGVLGVRRLFVPYPEEQVVKFDRSLPEAVRYGFERTWEMSSVTLRMLWKMVTLQVSHKNISGPVTIADVAGKTAQISWQSYVYFLAAISISLGVMNLLPIPMLDGGHLLTYSVEIVAGRSISEKLFIVGQKVGILLLLSLMSLAFYNDIFRLLN